MTSTPDNPQATILVGIGPWDIAPWRTAFASLGNRVRFWPQDGDIAVDRPYYLCAWKASPEFFRHFPAPRAIISLGAGVDHILTVADDIRCPVVRIVSPSLTGRMVEYVAMAVLYLHREVPLLRVRQRCKAWVDMIQPQASSVTVGIMGLGVMGHACAQALQALGYKVRGWSRSPHNDCGFPAFWGARGLPSFLKTVDVLVNLLPATPQTLGMIDAAVFADMGCPGLGHRYFVNAGRGETVNEDALITALQGGVLAGAVLDVFAHEPLDQESPLWSMDNVLITPHVAASSEPVAVVEEIVKAIACLEAGETPPNMVDRVKGY